MNTLFGTDASARSPESPAVKVALGITNKRQRGFSMNRSTAKTAAALVLGVSGLLTGSVATAAAWNSCDQWASWSNGGYTLYNNIWGSGAGPQTIWANSYSNWGVWANHPNTGGIKSYPNSTRYVGRRLSSLGSLTSSFNMSLPWGGAWTAAYDIWDTGHQHEIMLWMNYTNNADGSGNIKPISYNWNSSGNPVPTHWNVWIGGHSWNVFRGH